jgi:hypothetical protein
MVRREGRRCGWGMTSASGAEDRVVADAGHLGAPRGATPSHHQPVEHLVPVVFAVVDLHDPGSDHELLLGPGRAPVLDLGADVDGGPVGEVVTGQGGHTGGQEPGVELAVRYPGTGLTQVVEGEAAGPAGRQVGPERTQGLAHGGAVDRVRGA